MRKYRLFWLILFGLVSMAMLNAQQAGNQALVIEFIDGNNFSYTDATGIVYTYPNGVMEGDTIPVGATVNTGLRTSAELRIAPNGTLIKLAASTAFQVQAIATQDRNTNTFALVAGKVRAVAARGSSYDILTSTTVCGVRGTDFTMAYEEGTKALLMVKKGIVEFGERGADGIINPVMVNAGQFSEFFSSFAPQEFTQELFDQEYGDMDIPVERLPVEEELAEEVSEEPEEEAEEVKEEAVEEVAETTEAAPASGVTGAAIAATPAATGTESEAEAEAETPKAPAANSAIVTWLQEVLGMEIGAITIGDQVWSKAVIQPTFQIGKLKTALYLPIIYSSNLFDPDDWYKPSGNSEWSFGTDIGWKDNTVAALLDATRDLALKIRYLEYGNQQFDPFFFKVGNVNSFTIGHGLIMRNYANDSDFPATRHLGFNLGLDMQKWGFEILTNDLTQPEIIGGRLYGRPVAGSKIAFGVSAVTDLFPAKALDSEEAGTTAEDFGNPLFAGVGLDLDIPIVASPVFGIKLFGDIAGMLPYIRNDYTLPGQDLRVKGFGLDMLWYENQLRNWGAAAGFLGNILFVNYRLEYRYFTGAFRPAFFDAGYERRRMETVQQYAAYLADPASIAQSPNVMGIYGEGGASLLKDKLSFTFGYFWPFDITADVDSIVGTEDYFKAQLVVLKGLVPVVDISGSIIYERRNFIPTLLNKEGGSPSLFDENTTFGGELVMPIPTAPFLSLAIMVSTTLAREENGEIMQVDGKPVMQPLITLETRLRF